MNKKIVSVLSLLMIMVLFSTISVSAATKAPYKDVTAKTVDADSIKAINYVKSHSGYAGIIKKDTKFKPNKKITKREYIAILANFYGKKNVPVNINDVLGANGKVTAKWATSKMSQVAKKKKVSIKWSRLPKGTLSRADAARYVRIFATFDKALEPIK